MTARPEGAIQPQALEAEESVLGAMMMSEKAIIRVADILDDSDFYRESHAKIYRACLDLWTSGESVDAITVVAELTRRGQIDAIGGRVRVFEIAGLVPASANAAHYAKIVRERSFLRGLIRVGGELAQTGWEGEGTPDELLVKAEALLDDLRHRQHQERDETMTLHDAAVYLDAKFRDPPDDRLGIPGPWGFVPKMMGGRLYVLAGYSAFGKTAVAAQFFAAAVAALAPTTFLTLEMSKEDLAERVASTLGLPAHVAQTGRVPSEHEAVSRNVLERLTAAAPYGRIWDAPSADIATIRAHVKTARPALLIVDHLHQFHLRAEYERQDLEAVVRGLWRIAREFNMAVLLLAQLSRSADKRHPFPVPSLSALKGSGAIEQLAWAVWFIHRECDENNLPTDKSLFIAAKSRSGPTFTKPLLFHPREVRYTEVMRA